MFSSVFSLLATFFLVVLQSIAAAPVRRDTLIVVRPNITYPTANTVWPEGSKQNVTWETSNIPDEAKNYTCTLLLGYNANDSENLDTKHPLASQFPIMQGWIEITVPSNITERNDYIVVLIGDSGNASPEFTIVPGNTTPT